MEGKYRTLAAVIAGILGEIVSYYFFRGLLGFAAVITIATLLIFRFSPFPIIVGILISIDANLLRQNQLSNFYLVTGITLVVILLGIFSEILDTKVGTQTTKSLRKEFVSNCLVMSLGILLALIVQSIRCPQSILHNGTSSGEIVSSWLGVHACAATPLAGVITNAVKNKSISYPEIINAVFLLLLFIPLTWGLVFNALRQVRFNITRVLPIIGYIFVGLIGWWLSYIPYQIILWIISFFAVAKLGLEAPPPELLFVSLLLDMTLSILCVGYFTAIVARRYKNA